MPSFSPEQAACWLRPSRSAIPSMRNGNLKSYRRWRSLHPSEPGAGRCPSPLAPSLLSCQMAAKYHQAKAIALDMILENVSSESSNLYADLIKITNVSDAARPQYYLKRDRAILWDLHPRMPEAVTAVWEVSDSQTLPYSLQLRVEGAVFKPRDNLYAAPGWFPSGSVAEIRLPLANAGQGVLP